MTHPQQEGSPVGAVLVVGGGIGGMQAALDLADSGLKVYLVERQSAIGGHMAQLSETFPTLDCSQCILTPRTVEVGQHPNIRLLTLSEVVAVEREGRPESEGTLTPALSQRERGKKPG